MSVRPAVLRRLMRELTELKTNPPEGIRVVTNEDNMLDVTGIIQGPEGTPYAGGYFKVKFNFTEEFPAAPPKCRLLTKIFHPNVSGAGEICVNTLKKDWKSSYGIGHILVTVKCLLIYPNPESALDEEAGKLLLENYESYCERAKLITSVHATPKVPPPEFATPSSSAAEASTTTPSSSAPTISTTIVHPPSLPTNPIVKALPSMTSPHPLQSSNGFSPVSATEKEKPQSKEKERHVSPSPLSTADSNVGEAVNVTTPGTTSAPAPAKAIKRAAGTTSATGVEKRKKALKRL
ncbi:hypothetical protein NEOLEDRAFT_1093400 [Neolentinus lepideus HHB14362 ss-1]|uniref:E2 ubiquitin-conjugating enzyme n=1 Tax=Neolentinus lepideus HHB14362 ss-1 TaxID=1314782 RepID=A0A165SDJ8_9AGAM|nr:hypothetical protein NEOLEDRAFT_1093400 [Neolentinus lepideus HHB14362 ss-1]